MPYRPLPLMLFRAAAIVAAATLSSAPGAAELGEIATRSYIGQQLSADIELVMLTPDELDHLSVRLAGADVYKGANVGMNPVLASLRMSVVRRDARRFLHLTTFQPVETELLHLFLELGSGERGNVRAATVWLTPDPAPVVPVRAMPAAPSVPAPVAPVRVAASAPVNADSRPSATVPHTAVVDRSDTPRRMGGAAQPAPALALAYVGACTPPQPSAQARQCVALEHKNAALTSKLAKLEKKVELLQAALGKTPVPVAAPAPASASLPATAVAPAATKIKEKRTGPRVMTLIAGASVALLLVIGLAVHFLRRRKAGGSRGQLTLWQRWRKKKAAPAAAPIEPVLATE